jgi:hypothetical protein
MTVVLSHHVDVFDGVTQFSARPAIIELTDTNLFTLAKIEPATGVRTEVIFDNVPAAELVVGGTRSTLKFTHNGVSRRVDFSFGARVAGAFGIIGLIASSQMLKKSGIPEWLAALRAAGVKVSYWNQGRIFAIAFLAVLVIIVIVVVVTVGTTPN